MRRVIFLLVALAAVPTAAAAQVEGQAVALEYRGAPGVWLPEAMAARALEAVAERGPILRRVTLLEARLVLSTAQTAEARERAETWKAAAEAAEAERVRLAAPWRRPWVWFLVGLGLGLGAVGGAALAF